MNKIYIFGHQKPDTDSVTSAIALAYLKKHLGVKAEAFVLGEVNQETKFVLNYFDVKIPKYLNDVKLQIRDIEYHKDLFINKNTSLEDVYNYMLKREVTGVPIVDDNNKFLGLITSKILLKYLFEIENNIISTSYNNILKTLNGVEILRFEDEICGNVIAASYKSTTFLENIFLNENDILVVGNRHSIIENAINSGVKLIILTENAILKEEHLNIAKENKVNIIKTGLSSFSTIKKVNFSNYVGNIISDNRLYTVLESDYYDDFIKDANKMKFNNYPVVDKQNNCKGLIRLTELNKKNKKKVILVDHNEEAQSVVGLDEADILEVIDHHKIGDISTSMPINFRNMAVGSTNTIIYHLYKESHVEIPKNIAGIMLAGIISDTVNFKSPTTTLNDILASKHLEKISEIDVDTFSKEMFNASTSIKGKSIKDILLSDIKSFQYTEGTFSICQTLITDAKIILDEKDKYIEELENIKRDNKDNFILFVITDINLNSSYILYTHGMESILEESFNLPNVYEGYFIENLISRKTQVLPVIMETLN